MINENLKDIFTGKKTYRVIETVEVSHSESNLQFFLCKYTRPLELTLEDGTVQEFQPSNFIIDLPDFEENASMDISITFGSVNFDYIDKLENIIRNSDEKITVKYRFYTENAFDYPQTQQPFKLSITGVDIQRKNITLNGSNLISTLTQIPSQDFTVENFVGLKYLQA